MVTVSGTPERLSFAGGDLSYQVGGAPRSRLTGLAGAVTLQPELSYELRAQAQPLALATLTELFPALPFRSATLSGPIFVGGGPGQVRFDADLQGAAGGLRVSGTAQPGPPLRFDVSGRLQAFTPSAVLQGQLPVEGPVSGTFSAQGTAAAFGFSVDLNQTVGRFALRGRWGRAGALATSSSPAR